MDLNMDLIIGDLFLTVLPECEPIPALSIMTRPRGDTSRAVSFNQKWHFRDPQTDKTLKTDIYDILYLIG